MPVHVVRDLSLSSDGPECDASGQSIRIGLINNMPDAALKATERQFVNLLSSAAENVQVQLLLYSLPGVVRAESGRRHAESAYFNAEALPDHKLDAVIVTGSEPCAEDLREEPYWGNLTKVIDWAEENTRSAIWSCLAAHAAILHCDGIDRRRLSKKRFGVFRCQRVADDPLTVGVSGSFQAPHSRWNNVPEQELTDCGYSVLSRDTDGNVDSFAKRGKSLFLFFQGHPEYEANTLLLEYRRDVAVYLEGESKTYPALPEHYFDSQTSDLLCSFQDEVLSNKCRHLTASFSAAQLGKRVVNTWRPDAGRIYCNWIRYLIAQKPQH